MQKIILPWGMWYNHKILKLLPSKHWRVSTAANFVYEKNNFPTIFKQCRFDILKNRIEKMYPASIAIVVDDLTRPTPAYVILPRLIRMLQKLGYNNDSLHIYPATGAHRPLQHNDLRKKIGNYALRHATIHHHSPFLNFLQVGLTRCGAPISINKSFTQCDFKICIGSVLPHVSARFSGGIKLIVPIIIKVTTNNDVGIFNAYPFDTEFIQSGKALTIVKAHPTVVKKGGLCVISTAAPEGYGFHSLRGPDMMAPFDDDWLSSLGGRELVFFGPHITAQMIPGKIRTRVRIFHEWRSLRNYIDKKITASKINIVVVPYASTQIVKV